MHLETKGLKFYSSKHYWRQDLSLPFGDFNFLDSQRCTKFWNYEDNMIETCTVLKMWYLRVCTKKKNTLFFREIQHSFPTFMGVCKAIQLCRSSKESTQASTLPLLLLLLSYALENGKQHCKVYSDRDPST